MLQFCSVSRSLSHTNVTNKVRGIFFFKKSLLVFIIVRGYDYAYNILYYCVEYTTFSFPLSLSSDLFSSFLLSLSFPSAIQSAVDVEYIDCISS